MALNDYKLKFVIDADGRTARQEIDATYARINALGGGATATFGGMIPLASAAAVGIAAVGAAALTAGRALFDITQTAAEFGSKIYDASVKTGIAAETVSSLDLAAKQSGTSLESITGGIAKFSKTVGEAAEGSDKAAKKLTSLGVDPQDALNDLDGALGKVIKRIGEARPGVERMTLAQKAFGKSGADLLPMMEQVGFNLDEFRKKAKDLGVTIDDEAAAKADEFGDQLDVLQAQLAGVGRTIGTELMPEFTRMATGISEWIAQNKDGIGDFAVRISTLFGNFVRGLERVKNWLQANESYVRMAMAMATGGASELSRDFWIGVSTPRVKGPAPTAGGGGRGFAGSSYDPDESRSGRGSVRRPPKETDSEFRRFFEEMGFKVNRTTGRAINAGSPHTYGGAADISIIGKSADQIFQLMVKALEKGYRVFDERLKAPGVKQTGPHLHFENAKTSLTKASRILGMGFTPEQLAYLKELDKDRLGKATGLGGFERFQEKRSDAAAKAIEDEIKGAQEATDDYMAWEQEQSDRRTELRREEAALAVEILQGQLREGMIDEVDYAERVGQLRVDMIQDQIDELDKLWPTLENQHKIEKLMLEIATERQKKENDVADAIERQNEAFRKQLEGLQKKNQRSGTLKKREAIPNRGGFTGTVRDKDGNIVAGPGGTLLDGMDDATGRVRTMDDVMRQLGDTATDVFMKMGEGLGASLEAWTLLGSEADISLKKMVAQTLAGVAAQAATLAVFHTAMGIAALTPWGAAIYGPAPLHFKAAAIWGAVAVGAALGGRAAAGSSFQQGGGRGSSSGAYGGQRSDQNLPYTRQSENAYISGTKDQRDVWIERMIREVSGLKVSVTKFTNRVDSMRPGDVLVNGMRQKPGAVGQQAVSDIKRNARIGRDLGGSMGIRG